MGLWLLQQKNLNKLNEKNDCRVYAYVYEVEKPSASMFCVWAPVFEQSVHFVWDEQPPEPKGQLLWTMIEGRDDRITFPAI